MMKLAFALSAILGVVAGDINSNSIVGQHLLNTARQLNNNNQQNAEYADPWLSGYSIKFQGCHTIKQWNYAADDESDVRVMSKSLVRFRMCPSDSCVANKAAGCTTGYGDYVVDMSDFMGSWWEASRQNIEYACYEYLQTSCSCNDDDQQADDFNRDYCEYDCFNSAAKPECIDRNPYEEQEGGNNQNQFNAEDYMTCTQVKFNNNNKRQLNDNNNEEKYYVGPYCSGQGGSVFLGMFTDDACTVFSEVTYESLSGIALPYSTTTLVDASCVSCLEHNMEDQKQEQEGGYGDTDQVSESCENLYTEAGKCESSYAEGVVSSPNNNACTYMEGIKIVREDGMVYKSAVTKNTMATSFIVVFAFAFAGKFLRFFLTTQL